MPKAKPRVTDLTNVVPFPDAVKPVRHRGPQPVDWRRGSRCVPVKRSDLRKIDENITTACLMLYEYERLADLFRSNLFRAKANLSEAASRLGEAAALGQGGDPSDDGRAA